MIGRSKSLFHKNYSDRPDTPDAGVMTSTESRWAAAQPPRVESIQALVGNLELQICARLDRIESSLERIHGGLGHAACEETTPHHMPEAQGPGFSNRSLVAKVATTLLLPVRAESERPESFDESSTPKTEHLFLRPDWKEGTQTEAVAVLSEERKSYMDIVEFPETEKAIGDDDMQGRRWWIIPPGTHFRLAWDFFMCIVIAHDMAIVPISLAFETNDNVVSQALFWPFLVFWSLDVPLSFITGYYVNGRAEVRPAKIARNYLFSWFLLDMFMVGMSWFEAGSQGYMLGRAGKTLRVLRILRCVQIVRIAKLQKRFEEFHDRVTSDYYHIIIGIFKLVLTIVWLNHFIACCWWAIGRATSHGGDDDSWVSYGRFENTTVGFQYFSSLHWSLTQFTPAAMEVSARNLPERIFSVFILLFAMVSFSSFVSSITAAMTQLRQLNSAHENNSALLRRYLRLHEVPLDLTLRILQFVEYRLRKQKTEIPEHQVAFLQCLSTPLQKELSSHIFAPTLAQHPFFQRYFEVEAEAMRHVCLECVKPISLSAGDCLFTEGRRCEQMFFVTSGRLCYASVEKNRHSREEFSHAGNNQDHLAIPRVNTRAPKNDFLAAGEWCCEVSLWCHWIHTGTMTAMQMSEVLAVDVAAFTKATSFFHLVHGFSSRYGNYYVLKVKEYGRDGMDVSDLSPFSVDTLEEIVERAYLKRRTAEQESKIRAVEQNPEPSRNQKAAGELRAAADEPDLFKI